MEIINPKDKQKGKTLKIEIKLNATLLKAFDEWWKAHGFNSRSEAVRSFIRRAVMT